MKNDFRSKAAFVIVLYICFICCSCSASAYDFIDEGNHADYEEENNAAGQYTEESGDDQKPEEVINEGNHADYDEIISKIDSVIELLKGSNDNQDEIIGNIKQLNKALDEFVKTLDKKDTKSDPEEITLATLHDDNYKVMAVIFIGFGLILGFFIISKVLL